MKELLEKIRRETGLEIRDFRNAGKGFGILKQPNDLTMLKIGYSVADNFTINLNMARPSDGKMTAQAALKLRVELGRAYKIIVELNANLTTTKK